MALTTWDSGFCASGITLSGGNLTATSTVASSVAVRSTTSQLSGLVYWEVTVSTVKTNVAVGFGNASETTTPGAGIGGDANSAAIYLVSPAQTIYVANSAISAGSAASANGVVVGCALNLNTGRWFISTDVMRAAGTPWNNSATDNPATNTGGIPLTGLGAGPYYAFFNDETGGAVATANFGATAFSLTVPAGYTAWNSAGAGLNGSAAAASTVSGSLTARGTLSGSAAAASSIAGALTNPALMGPLSGTVSAASAITGSMMTATIAPRVSIAGAELPPLATYQAGDYLAAMLALGHRGRAWPLEPDTVRAKIMLALAQSYVRSGARAVNLVYDAFPPVTVELLPEWEASLGLPDPCAVQPQTFQQRQAAVLQRFIAGGGQTIAYYKSVAAALGYSITITEFRPFQAGTSTAGTGCGAAFAHAWQVNAPTYSVGSFIAGASTAGEPLRWWGNTALQCTLRALAPAQTTVLFNYT